MSEYWISILKEEDYEDYKRFLEENKTSRYEHSLEIKDLVSKYFKFKPIYLIARENADEKNKDEIVGALPLFEAKSFIEGKRLVSVPFFPFGGVIGKDIECKKALLDKAKNVASNYKFLEIRQRNEWKSELEEGFVKQTPIIDFLLHFKETEGETFNSLDKRVRYDIRKAQKNNLKVKLGKEKELFNDFYKIYLNTKKKRGVPAWPKGLFSEAIEKSNFLVGVTYLNQKPIAGGLFILQPEYKEIEYGFGGVDYKYARLCPYYILLWEIVKYGIKNNYEVLDFGGTTKELNEGNLYAFKDRWCKEKKEIPYYFYSLKKENIPALQNDFKLYKLYGKIWGLLPKWVIKRISPLVIRQFK